MTTPIRPGLTPLPSPAPQKSAQALAAQRAFFQQALAQAGQPVAPTATPAVQTIQTTTVSAAAPATSGEPMPRLGRYLDIRV
jgi:hypothetical protein